MTDLAIAEYGQVPIGQSGFSKPQSADLLTAAKTHPLATGDGSNILYERNGHLHVGQMVGVLAARNCSLEILPKVDPEAPLAEAKAVRGRLVEMIDVALDLKLGAGEAASMSREATSLLEILIRIFADRLLTEVRRGLPRSYLPHEEDLPTLRGRLDVRRQFTVHAVRPDRLACRYDALSGDTPLMQLMKACVLRLLPLARRTGTRRLLDELRILLADVSDVPLAKLPKKIQIDRTTSRWRSLLDLARLLLGKRWQDTRTAARMPDGVSLLFPMNDLFEAYVTALARRAVASLGIEVRSQCGGVFCLADWQDDDDQTPGRLFATRPDIMLRKSGSTVAIIDTKWKLIGRDITDKKRGVSQADVYQMMAYGQLYGVKRLMLLYPWHRGLEEAGPVANHRIATVGGARLDIATVDVGAGRRDVIAALGKLLGPLGSGVSKQSASQLEIETP